MNGKYYTYADPDGAVVQINAYRAIRHGEQIYMRTPEDGAYVKPDDVADVAAGFLEAKGVEPADLSRSFSPETHEAMALAHLKQARVVRDQEAEIARDHAEADQYRQLYPDLDPYEGVTWEAMTDQGKCLHLKRYRTARQFVISKQQEEKK